MATHSIIKHILSDKDSLSEYNNGKITAFEDIKRRLLLLERQENRNIPDHYYRLNQAQSFEGIESLDELIRIGLYRLAKDHLELRGNRIYVKQIRQNDWQKLITYIPPLILQMAFLHIAAPMTASSPVDRLKYFNKYILPNTKYTALPYPYVPQIEHYIKEKKGLHDLHMHLNGTTEVDIEWQDFLKEPDKVYKDLQEKHRTEPMVREQFEQESYLHSPMGFRNLLLCARNIREYLFFVIFLPKSTKKDLQKNDSTRMLLHNLLDSTSAIPNEENPFSGSSVFHPFAQLVCENYKDVKYPMAVEGLMYILVFKYLSENPRESTSSIFHFYLLILGLSNRLSVQQTHQYGFEQFQKLTVNNLRENSEKLYKSRFLQLHGNEQHNICFLEGRFSPKATEKENRELIQSIYLGWNALLKEIKNELEIRENSPPELKLIAHFIKKKDDKNSTQIRHKKLRCDVWSKAKVLALLKENNPSLMKNVVGVDAASSEFDASPEIFAPAFRYLRRKGFNHFTYHAGEDFFHIICGLRAIFEVVAFNNLSCGDRIGHATAAGVSPERWMQNVGGKILIRQGAYLDDLLFAYHLIITKKNHTLKRTFPTLINKIHELSRIIYGKSYSLKTLEDAWLNRRFCPVLLFSGKKENAMLQSVFDDDEWTDIESEFVNLQKDERIEVLRKYHCKSFKKEYDKIIEVDIEEFFNCSELYLLQKLVLEILHDKEIIIETLPTSNVRIGHHSDFTTYHLWNWLEMEKQGVPIPPIVVGTDDPGIFATNIYNEYANIYCNLTCHRKMSHNEAMEVIEKLDKNAHIYRFSC